MKRVITALVVMTLSAASAAAETPVAEVSQLQLYSSFWQNLHHFLYVSAWATRPVVPGQPRLAMPLPPGSDVSMAPDEKATWDHAVTVYERDFASRDLLFGQRMTMIKLGLVDRDDKLTGAPYDDELKTLLLSAAPIYRKYWWPAHDAGNAPGSKCGAGRRSMRRDCRAAHRVVRRAVVRGPARDVVRVGESGRVHIAQSTHIVVASSDRVTSSGPASRCCFKESSHGLIQKSVGRGERRVAASNKRANDLRHVVLFYTAGEVTRQELANDGVSYKPYLYATGLFDRAWPRFRAPVEQHVQGYIDGKTTLDQMAVGLAAAIP
jgi:hypothetical protein